MIYIFRFLRGYLRIAVRGDSPQRILTLAAKNRISLWNSKYKKNGIEANVYMRDFFSLPLIVRKTGLRVHILNKKGLPFVIRKNRFRLGFFSGIILMFIFLQIMSGYIWVIDVNGNSKVKSEDILNACNSIGIKVGVRSKNINAKVLREKLLLKIDSLAWCSLNVEGSRLTVNVSEIKEKTDNNEPSNLKASRDGIIKYIDVSEGDCLVKIGDTVKQGDVLVSGVRETSDGTVFSPSSGKITAETVRHYTCEKKYKQNLKIPNGRVKNKYLIELFGLKIPLYLGNETKEYTSSLKISKASLFGKSIPVTLYRRRFLFCNTKTVIYSEDELTQEINRELMDMIKKDKIEDYEMADAQAFKSEEGIKITLKISTLENIAVSQGIIVKK